MNEDRLLQMLGLARRAKRLSLGHDAALGALLGGKARLCLLSADASDRLAKEFRRAAEGKLAVIRTAYPTDTLGAAIGSRAGVLTIDDTGFAQKVHELCRANNWEEC